MPKRTPSEAATKWSTNLSASTTEIELGVNKVTVAPSQKAIAQKEKMRDNWLDAIESGRWEAALGAVDLNTWKRLMIDVGIRRIRDGALKAVPKLQRYYEYAFPQMQALQDSIASRPKRDLNDSLENVRLWMQGMQEISRNRR